MLLDFRTELSPTIALHKPFPGHVDALLLHRISLGTRAKDVVAAFTGGIPEAAKATGNKQPYHFLVERDGAVVQCLPVGVQGPHAWKWNKRSLAIACIGDFRRQVPPVAQWRAAVTLAALLATPQQWEILGHDEAPYGSKDPGKHCPGDLWNMNRFREGVKTAGVASKDVSDLWRYLVI